MRATHAINNIYKLISLWIDGDFKDRDRLKLIFWFRPKPKLGRKLTIDFCPKPTAES